LKGKLKKKVDDGVPHSAYLQELCSSLVDMASAQDEPENISCVIATFEHTSDTFHAIVI